MRGQDSVQAGDRILTSGDGGGFPRGLPIGVAANGIDGSWRVKLFSDRGAIDYVRVLRELQGYSGWIVVEAEQDPKKAEPAAYARLGHANLARFIAAAGLA